MAARIERRPVNFIAEQFGIFCDVKFKSVSVFEATTIETLQRWALMLKRQFQPSSPTVRA